MSYETLLFDVSGPVARITLNRPEAANSLNDVMARELMLAAIHCDEDPAIRAVLLTGAGKMFSAGGDLKTFSGFGAETGARLKEITTYFHAAISRFARMDAPLVVAVNGMAAGAGMSLAASGDLVLARSTMNTSAAIALMHTHKVRRLVVVVVAGGLSAIATMEDLLEAMARDLADLASGLRGARDREFEQGQ